MGVIDKEFSRQFLTNNPSIEKDVNGKDIKVFNPVSYRWTHGATNFHLGDGLLIYSIIQLMRYKTCVCLGSGAGFIPRIMTQARLDLHDQEIFEGDSDYNHGDIGETYLVDAANGIGGKIDYSEEDSFFRYQFFCLIQSTRPRSWFCRFGCFYIVTWCECCSRSHCCCRSGSAK